MIIHNPILTGSFSVNGADLSTITGSVATSASFDARTTYLESTSSILTAASASQSVTSGSLVAASASLSATSGSLSAASGSFNTRVSALEATGSALTSSLTTVSSSGYATSASLSAASGSFNSRTTNLETYTTNWTAVSASFARTGSNNFRAPQYVSDTTVPTGFSNTTASIYTDGGLQVTKDSYFSGSMYIKGNLTIYGTQSIAYITSSQLNIATNLITVNTATPSIRFGGIAVQDSGSATGLTGSLLWDSQNNTWLYDNPSGSGNYDSAMVIMGPRNSSALGNEQGLTCNYLVQGHGSHHTTSSMIYHDVNSTCFYSTALIVSGSGIASVGTTPSAWSGFTALQSGNGAVWSTGANNTHFSSNTYYDGANRIYISTGTATEYASQNGAHWWGIAASGTGGTAQSMTEYMRLNTTGLGIGTTNPGYLLDVCGTGRFTCNLTVGGATAATNVQLILNGVSSKAQRILFQNSGTDQWLLGAGAASETSAFEIYNATGTIVLSINKSTNVSTFTGGGIIGNSSNNLYLSSNSAAGEISFWGNQLNTRLMTLTGCGNLGIGCVPSSAIKLQVYQCDAALNAFRAQHVNGNAILVNASYNYYDAYEHNFRCMGGGATYLTIGATGNVGIGANNPQQILSVNNPFSSLNALYPVIISQTGNAEIGGMYSTADSITNPIGAGLAFKTYQVNVGLTEKIRITHAGYMGIGCTAPSGKLQVANSSAQYAVYTLGGNLELYTPEGNCGYVRLGSAYNLNGVYGSCGLNYIVSGTSAHAFRTTDNNTERLRIFSTGEACFSCQVCVPRLTLNSTNTGTIDLGTINTGGVANQIIGGQYSGYAYTGRLSFKVGTWGAGTDYGPTEQMFMEVQGADTKKISMGIATNGGSVGIGTSSPKHNFDINSVLTNAGGFAFCNMVTAQGTWSTFACVGSDANVVTTITYTNTNDHNRSGVFIARWSYNDTCATLFIRSCLWNDSQNIVTLAFRNYLSGALQICVSGGGGDYRVQALTQGTKAT